MGRYAIMDKNTGIVLNVIEAEPEFFETKPDIYVGETKIDLDSVEVFMSTVASVDDIVIDGKVYRYCGNVGD